MFLIFRRFLLYGRLPSCRPGKKKQQGFQDAEEVN